MSNNQSPTINNHVKRILILSTLVIITIPTYSQSNSKILQSLQDNLGDKKIYFESLDSIANKYYGNIVSREKKVLLPDYRKTTELQRHDVTFEDLIKVVPADFKLLGQYPVDTIFFYFNQNKLTKCLYQFTLPVVDYKVRERAIDSIYNKLNISFNLGKDGWETNIYGYRGYCWADEVSEVNLLTNLPSIHAPDQVDRDPVAYLSIELFKSNPPNALLDKQTTQIKTNRSGRGNSSFNISLSKLEQIIKTHTTLTALENQLGTWSSFGAFNNVEFEYSEVTKNLSIPLYSIEYETTIKSKLYYIHAEVRNLKGPLKSFEFTTSLNGLQLAEFEKSLIANNYLLNKNLTSILRKVTYQNPTKKLMITIRENGNGTYTIQIS